MSITTNLLTKAGYELISIFGDNVFPCTVIKEGKPLGFIHENGTVELMAQYESSRAELEAINHFAQEHNGLKQLPEGWLMLDFKGCMLIADYDIQKQQTVYKIYEQRNNGELSLISSRPSQNEAVEEFWRVSRLMVSPVSKQRQEQEQNQQPQYVTQQSNQEKQYQIVNQEGQEVGYVDRSGKVTMYDQKKEPRRPSFLEILRKKLSEIQMSIRVHYEKRGAHFAIRDKNQRDVAYLRPEEPTDIQYTNNATPEQRGKISTIVQDVLRETQEIEPVQRPVQTEQTAPVHQPVQVEQAAPVQQPVQVEQTVPVQQATPVQQAVPVQQTVPVEQAAPVQQTAPVQLTPEAQREKAIILADFDKKMNEMKMMEGFNPQLSQTQTDIIAQMYGTTDRQALEKSIDLGYINLKDLDQNFERAGLKAQWEALLPKAQKDQLTPPQKGEPDRA